MLLICSNGMGKGYCEESRMGRILDHLASRGIDCVKIIPSKHKFDATVFLLLGIGGENFCKICRCLEVGDMIQPSIMKGENIKLEREFKGLNPNAKYGNVTLKFEEDRRYNVLEIKYVYCEIGAKLSQKVGLNYLKPSA